MLVLQSALCDQQHQFMQSPQTATSRRSISLTKTRQICTKLYSYQYEPTYTSRRLVCFSSPEWAEHGSCDPGPVIHSTLWGYQSYAKPTPAPTIYSRPISSNLLLHVQSRCACLPSFLVERPATYTSMSNLLSLPCFLRNSYFTYSHSAII